MVTALRDHAPTVRHTVYEAVFLRDPPRPVAGQLVLERFRLAGAAERMPQTLADQPGDSPGHNAVALYPILVVFPRLSREGDFLE